MSKKDSNQKATNSGTRGCLIDAAKRIFARKGFEGATVKDLADEASANISLVSYHFGGKEGLYRACLEGAAIEGLERAERVLKTPTSKDEFKLRLKLFAEDVVDVHKRDPETCKIIHRGMEAMDPVTLDLYHSVFIHIFQALQNFVLEAQKAEIVRKELDPEMTTTLLFGSLIHFVKMDEMRRLAKLKTLDEASFVASFIDHWISSFTQGIFTS